MARLLQRLSICLAWLAFALVMLAPALARAALVPTCDAHDQLTRMPVEWLAPAPAQAEDACTLLAAVPSDTEDLGDVRVAAMCDDRGASVVAPQRILPITDARIEAAPCSLDLTGPFAGPAPSQLPPATASPALAEHAVLDGAGVVPPASFEVAPPFLPVAGGPRAGFERAVDHPPR